MSNRQERRNNRMSKRLLTLFGQAYSIHWQGHTAHLTSYPEQEVGPRVEVSFIGNNYVVKAPALQFHWQGNHLPTAAKQLKLLTMLGG